MALILLPVIVLGVTAAAAHDVPITWSHSPRAALPCVVPEWSRRRPPALLDEDRAKSVRHYVWRRGATKLNEKRIFSNGSLEVVKKRDGDGVYQCLVRQHSRLVLGVPINLKFPHIEKQFTVHPGNQTAWLGQPTVLGCSIDSGPPANISWEKDGHNITLLHDARYRIVNNELIITDVRQEDAGWYRCKATNVYLNRTPTSNAGLLQVQESEDQEPAFLDVHYENNVTVARGGQVQLACPVLGWPRPKVNWKLTTTDNRTYNLNVSSEILVLSQLDFDQEGLYSCSVEGRNDLEKTFTLSLWEPVKIILPPASKESIRASTVRFNCTASGRPAPNITWYKDGSPLALSGRSILRTSTDKTRIELVISGVTSQDAGTYQCFASNGRSVSTAWAALSVRGASTTPPADVTCAPLDARRVRVRWRPPAARLGYMYIVDVTPIDKAGESLTGQPHNVTNATVSLREPLAPYVFQVRAFLQRPGTGNTTQWMGVPSDLSQPVVCQGQGVPIKLVKLETDEVLVSWRQFAEQTPGVLEWLLQSRRQGREHNITLPADVHNYTLPAPPDSPLEVRVLGSRTVPWLRQDLSWLPWNSTTSAVSRDQDLGDMIPVPWELQVKSLGGRNYSVSWRVDEPERYTFQVCVRPLDGDEVCTESVSTSTTVGQLQPGAQYEVRVQAVQRGRARAGGFSAPLLLATPYEPSLRFKNLSYRFINSSTLLVWWAGDPARPLRYTVQHSIQLKLPVDQWAAIEVFDNSATIHGVDPAEPMFVMVKGYEPKEYSPVLSIPPQNNDVDESRHTVNITNTEVKGLKYTYSSDGVTVWWSPKGSENVAGSENSVDPGTAGGLESAGSPGGTRAACAKPHIVRYSQNITRPVEEWHAVNVSDCSVEIRELEPNVPLYVMVTHTQMLTIQPRPPEKFNYYLVSGVGVGCVLALCLLLAVGVCVWRRRKRTPTRRRRVMSGDDTLEDCSEMKGVSSTGARLANGGAPDAGEPLLNGHVHITENPASKTPNGRMKKARNYEAFDVSRHDADTTTETSLHDSTAYSLLDTSRPPDYDAGNKLPDDNMNSELNRSVVALDNSKIHPTLQPNG